MAIDLGNIITAMVTPFKNDPELSVDFTAAVSLANHLLKNGTDTLLLTGSTGEDAQLSPDEKWQLIRSVRQNTPAGTRLVVSTGDTNTNRAIAKARKAFDLGADAVLVAVPEYIRPTQQAMEIHFGAIARAIAPKPMLIYNIPGRVGSEILPDTVMSLAYAHTNIIGLKQSHNNLARVSEMKGHYLSAFRSDFQIYSGDDNLTLPMLALGAKGVVSVASHLEGRLIQCMIREFQSGHTERALKIHQGLFPLFEALFMETNPLPVKEALCQQGMIETARLRTLGEMSPYDKNRLSVILHMFAQPKCIGKMPLNREELIQKNVVGLRRMMGRFRH